MIITRFAPSPTGYLHIGNLRNALFSYLVAKKDGGKFLLRIEDTDQRRFVADSMVRMLKTLYHVDIIPDEGIKLQQDQEGNFSTIQEGADGPYIQSERLAIYKKYIDVLIGRRQAYYCFCAQDRLDEMKKSQQINKLPTGYDKHCRKIIMEDAKKRVAAGEPHTVRLKMPETGDTVFNDIVRGVVSFKNELIDDQVLIKSDGFPTYHFAAVVDDHLMKITHVIRGEEWLSSTPKHLQLYKYFGWEPPSFAHPPLLLNSDRSKLSKRQGDVAVEDYLKKGFLPEAIINFIAFLGWNPGGEREIFSLEELCHEFSLSKVNKSGAIFNLEKLNWYNKQYIKKMNSRELAESAKVWLVEANLYAGIDETKLLKAVELEKDRITTLDELPEAISFLFNLPKYNASALVWKKNTREETSKILLDVVKVIVETEEHDWNKDIIEQIIRSFITDGGYDNGSVLWPLRVSLSGRQKSPKPFEIAEVLGRKESLHRIRYAIGMLNEKL
ncbi:MAG: glutamate--tRNA ligase [bacterium]